jgi:16S rRNA (cytosine967-C5)-methyltransferase
MTNAREVAFDALLSVESHDTYLNLVLPKLLQKAKLSAADSAFATELTYGTSRWQGFYDWVISRATNRSVEEIDADALVVMRLGVHQLLELKTPAHAAIYETVNLAKRKLKASVVGLVNATLRRVSEKSRFEWLNILRSENLSLDEELSILHSHPLWVTRSLKQALQSEGSQSELELALESDNIAPKINLVKLPGKDSSLEQSISKGEASPIGYVLEQGDPSLLGGVSTGALRVQDQGSQLAALALERAKHPAKGETWLDLCAGPGGKAVLLAALAQQDGATLTTNEVSEHRAKLVETAIRHCQTTSTGWSQTS